jgi:hypothetical protein
MNIRCPYYHKRRKHCKCDLYPLENTDKCNGDMTNCPQNEGDKD